MKKFAFSRNEIAGSLGDLGLFVPIVAALVMINHMNATIILLSAGLLYIASGLYFKVPMPVQPFKAVASIAIALSLAPRVISASGILMGLLLAIIALTPLSNYLTKIFNKPVIRGVQLIIGLFLIKAGYALLTSKPFFINQKLSFRVANTINLNYIVAIATVVLLIVFLKNKKIPSALTVLSFGLLVGIILNGFKFLAAAKFGPQPVTLAIPSVRDFYTALVLLVVVQLPTTLANSVIATNDVSKKYFGDRSNKVKPKSLLASLSIANLSFGFLGGMPLCHGAGGMTAHYKFGARTAGSNIIIGSLFIILALFFGKFAIAILSLIPACVYAVLLFYLGFQHALLIRDLAKKQSYAVTLGMGALALLTQNLLLSIGLGYLADFVLNKTSLKLNFSNKLKS